MPLAIDRDPAQTPGEQAWIDRAIAAAAAVR
jgi:hypothetical protein